MKQLVTSYCLALLLGCYLLLAPSQGTAQVLHGTFAGNYQHSLSIHADGSLWATGDNTYGQLGTGSTTSTTTWVQVGAATNWVQVAAGSTHSLGLRADGSLYAWGSNQYGQLGTTTNAGTTVVNSTPTRVGTDTYTQIAAGNYHCLGLRADGSLYAWGQNNVGQLGNATNTGTTAPNPTPTRVGTDTYTQVAAGALYYSMALKADGSLYAWGDNYYGQLGTTVNSGTRAPTPLPTRVGTDTYTQVVAGNSHCLALKADGSLYAWGDNYYGQLGNTTNFFSYTPNPTPTRVGTATYTQVAAGFEFTLGLRADGSLYAWGINGAGELGTTINFNMGQPNPTPLRVGTATNWVQVTAGFGHSLGLRADGSLYTWGYNSAGQLGNGNTYSTPTPTATSTALPTRSTAAGFNFGLAVKADGTLWAWGNNSYGQLGNGTTTASLSPRQIGTDHDWLQVAAGAYHSLALKADGTLWAWGLNLQGQLGLASTSGTYSSTSIPTQVGTGLYTQVAAGHSYSLGLRADGSLYAWGSNQYGQLGTTANNGTTNPTPTPTQVGTDLYTQMAAGYYHSLALRADGALYAWGNNYSGELGSPNSGPATTSATPVHVGTTPYTQVAAGGFHSLALQADGSLYAWGQNNAGQLGQGSSTTGANPTPMRVGTDTYTQAVGGDLHSLGLRADGSIYSWGQNDTGQLGIGSISPTTKLTPTREATMGTSWTTLAPGSTSASSLVRTASGLAFASAGNNDSGQLGDGTTNIATRFDRNSPLSSLQPLPVLASAAGLSSLALAPNPASHHATTLRGAAPGSAVQVFDARGRLVLAARTDATGTTSLALPTGLAPGVYVVRSGQQALRLAVE